MTLYLIDFRKKYGKLKKCTVQEFTTNLIFFTKKKFV